MQKATGTTNRLLPAKPLQKEQISELRLRLRALHEGTEERSYREESRTQSFARSYKDNEVDNEEEEKMHMTQAALPMKPFGLNIRKAAYKATFGSG